MSCRHRQCAARSKWRLARSRTCTVPTNTDTLSSYAAAPDTRYAKAGDVHVAYQVVGEGPPDLVLVSTWFSHVEARWDFPGFAYYLRRLASFSRLISFDKRGIGLSDPVALEHLPLLEEWMDDVRAVMDTVGSERAVVMGANEGTLMAAMFAATYPERVSALVLANATARPAWAPDHPWGVQPEISQALIETVDQTWGEGLTMAAVNPTIAGDEETTQAWGRFLRLAASPAVAAAVIRMIFELDVRAILPTIRVPTLVVSRRDNPLFPADAGRAVAELIPGAVFVEVPGADYGLAVGDVDPVIDEVEAFVTGTRPTHDADRVLATVLFTDIVDSTARAAQLGDRGWRAIWTRTRRSRARRFRRTAVSSPISPETVSWRPSTVLRAQFARRSPCGTACTLSGWRSVPVSIRERSRGVIGASQGSVSISLLV